MKYLISFLLFSFTAHAGMMEVTSTYTDQAKTTRTLKVKGSGFLFSYGDRQRMNHNVF